MFFYFKGTLPIGRSPAAYPQRVRRIAETALQCSRLEQVVNSSLLLIL